MKEPVLQGELERMHPESFGWALWCCNYRREEAEEVLQTTYLKILEGAAKFDGRSSPRTWLFAVIRRTAQERRRRQWLRGHLFDRWRASQPEAATASDPEGGAIVAESNQALLQALAELSTRQRELLHLVFYQDLTVEEAASVLSVSVGTARTHFERGKRQLRKLLAQPGGRT
jgi:RNA polymerase sigma-70 factor (ECF subfamily)